MADALLIDDEADHVEGLAALVAREGFTVRTAGTLAEARRLLSEAVPDVVLTDLVLPDGNGIDLLNDLDGTPRPEVILVTGHASIESAVAALRGGVLDYLTKPVDTARLKTVLANVLRTLDLKTQIGSLRGELRKLGRFGPLIGASAAMQRVYDLVAKVGPTEAGVLITGESGTGKELVAQTIHELSPRKDQPFVAINCGAVSATLIESELFGHEKGSFTGATKQHQGHFERASGGTLFLDEITEMPTELQVKLLRALETGSLLRIGGTEAIEVDCRVVAATNRDPAGAVQSGTRRDDLYYRLNVFMIPLPPLREREGDVALLAEHILDGLNEAEDARKRFAPDALAALARHDWPGNVRELRNAVQRAFIMATDAIDAACLPFDPATRVAPVAAGPTTAPRAGVSLAGVSLKEAERQLILDTLAQANGDKKHAAKILGISLKTMYNRLKAYEQERG
jgi:DNA-binding NtrC family response regulator